MGRPISPASVSRLSRELDTQVAAFHRRPATFAARYLPVDGLWVSVRSSGRARRRVVLAAYGIDEVLAEFTVDRDGSGWTLESWRLKVSGEFCNRE